VQENYRKFQCQKCDFSLWRVTASREWAPEEIAELIGKRFVGPLSGFRSRMGKPFSAGVRLTDDLRAEFDFGQASDENAEAPDFSGQESLGPCPKCGARVFEHGVSYVCEKSVGPERTCDFRSGKIILQQPVERAQMQKLLATGRTDLLTQFVSPKRGGRRFKAYLAKKPDGKVGFEFEPRAERPAAAQARRGAPAKAAVEEPAPPPRAEEPSAKALTASSRRVPKRSKAASKKAAKPARAAAPKPAAKTRRKAA